MVEQDMRDWLKTRGRPHTATFTGFAQSGEAPDPDWMLEPPVEIGTVISNDIRVGLAYGDEAAETRRIVRLRRLWREENAILLGGICELRQGWRSFRVDAIKQCFIPATGQVCSADDLFRGLGFDPNATPSVADYWTHVRACAVVLMALADADGVVLPSEVAIVGRYAKSLADKLDLAIPEEELFNLRTALPALNPTPASVEAALETIARDRDALPLFLTAVKDLVNADGAVSPEEQVFIAAMVARLRDLG
jgi:Tellurite resistance protein TerB